MAATSDVQICSNALLLLGANPIASFDEDGAGARLSANLWALVRDTVLRSHPWNCATKRVALAPATPGPAFDWAYQFLLPGGWLRTMSVGLAGDTPEYEMSDGYILMDSPICYLRYVYSLVDVTRYESLLTMAMVAGMAANMAYPITKSQSQQDAMVKLYQFHLKQARSVNGMEDTPEDFGDSPLITVRG